MDNAKEIFIRYGGNHGLMHQDGVYSEYQKSNVSSLQEAAWAKELERALLEELNEVTFVDHRFYELLNLIRTFRSVEGLRSLTSIVVSWRPTADSFTMLLATESISEAYFFFCKSDNLKDQGLQEVSCQIKGLISKLRTQEVIAICDTYKQDGMFLPGALSDESVRRRIGVLIKKFEL